MRPADAAPALVLGVVFAVVLYALRGDVVIPIVGGVTAAAAWLVVAAWRRRRT